MTGGIEMDVSSQEAQEALRLVENTQIQWRKAIGASYAGSLLLLWGGIWIIAYATMYFSPQIGGYVFTALDVLGIVGTVLIARRWPLKGPEAKAMALRMTALWLLLCLYALLWIILLRPATSNQIGAFLCTTGMFGYVVIGLWFRSPFMIVLGLAVTVLTVAGFYLVPHHFYLWIALTGGGTLMGTGLYIRRRR
jgi:hypothetical protein